MHKTYRYKARGAVSIRGAAVQLPLTVKGLAILFFLCVVIRVFSVLGADTATTNYMSGLVSDENIVDSILNFELGAAGRSGNDVTLSSLILDSSIFNPDPDTPAVSTSSIASPEPSAAAPTASADSGNTIDTGLYYDGWSSQNSSPFVKPNIITQPADQTDTDSIAVTNKTDYSVNTAALLKEPLNMKLSGDSPVVLIIHTHSSEAYMPDGTDQYAASDPYRTENKNYSIIRVGDELGSALAKKGIAFIHDRNIYDYPSYQGAYNRSYDAIQAYLKQYPSIKMVIDMHRDAIEAADGSVYKTIAQIDNTTCAQVLLVMGTNASGLSHPNWRENFKLALHIQASMDKLYPSLAKPIELSQYRYNQQATTGSMIVEIGCTGNTLQESLTSVRYFADAFSEVVLKQYK